MSGFTVILRGRRSQIDDATADTYWTLDPADPTVAVLAPGRSVTLHNVHLESVCAGRPCVIHAPSNHHMRSWPLRWRDDRGRAERLCLHGIGHPDPDEFRGGLHGCDGCCSSAPATPRLERSDDDG